VPDQRRGAGRARPIAGSHDAASQQRIITRCASEGPGGQRSQFDDLLVAEPTARVIRCRRVPTRGASRSRFTSTRRSALTRFPGRVEARSLCKARAGTVVGWLFHWPVVGCERQGRTQSDEVGSGLVRCALSVYLEPIREFNFPVLGSAVHYCRKLQARNTNRGTEDGERDRALRFLGSVRLERLERSPIDGARCVPDEVAYCIDAAAPAGSTV
jgi:hypothetical protein